MRKHRLLLACGLGLFAASTWAQRIQPPPRPVGSSLVVVQPGLNPVERERDTRAHRGKVHAPVKSVVRKPSDGDTKGFFFGTAKRPAR